MSAYKENYRKKSENFLSPNKYNHDNHNTENINDNNNNHEICKHNNNINNDINENENLNNNVNHSNSDGNSDNKVARMSSQPKDQIWEKFEIIYY
ncbi:6013_t:CDS:1, partial [Acaulospora morrowiae]